jgi:hypothetical protein
MKNLTYFILIAIILSSCSSGKKALQKGDYFSAVYKAVDRLKSDPDNSKAISVLREGYPLTLQWSQEELDMILSNNNAFKWEQSINIMNQVNNLARQIRSTPAARKIISNPKTYTSELTMATEKAAVERYNAGLYELDKNTRESARMAFSHFQMADRFIPGYKDVFEKMEESKQLATIHVVLEAIPVNTTAFKLSSEFFYDQVYEFLNNRYPRESFVNFYSPGQAENMGLEYPDYFVEMNFFDFTVGNTSHSEKEETVKKRVQIESKDTTRIQYKNYEAKIKIFTDEVVSGGLLDLRIIESPENKLVLNNRIPGSFTWVNDYAIFVGDIEALDKNQTELIKRKAAPLPPKQDLFIEFTKPIYSQLTTELNQFFRRFN